MRQPRRVDLGTLLRERADAYPDRPFLTLTETGATRSYGEFNADVNRVAAGLAKLGAAPGTYVNVMLHNSLEQLLASYAIKKLGAVEVAINAEFRGAALARMINLSRSSLLVTSPALLEHVAAIDGDLAHLDTIVVTGSGEPVAAGGRRMVEFESLLAEPAREPDHRATDVDIATVIFTSGTTGPSKGCLLPHRALVRAAESVVDALELQPDDRVYTPYPLFHMRAAYLDVLSAMLVGARVVVAPRFSASRFWVDMREFDVTTFSLLGTVMQILWKRDPSPRDRDHAVRVTWGGPINVDRNAFEERFGIAVLPGEGVFGMTETGMLNMSSFDSRTSGLVRPIYDVRIADDYDDAVPPDEIGEILVRPNEPAVMFGGYLNMPEATVAATRNQWFHTGDLGRMDAQGRMVFAGRKRDMIRRGGHNISAFEVEEVVNGHQEVLESAALGVPSALGEEELKVYVVPRPGAELDVDDLLDFCRGRMAGFMVPQHVELIAEIPKTATGKVATARLLELHEAHASG